MTHGSNASRLGMRTALAITALAGGLRTASAAALEPAVPSAGAAVQTFDRPQSSITTPPVLSGSWTRYTIDLEWTDAEPLSEVTGYRVHYADASGTYDFTLDVGLVNTVRLRDLEPNRNWYFVVTALDAAGGESEPSNEHVDAVAGTIAFQAVAASHLRLDWGADFDNGREAHAPVTFPEGEWVEATVTVTLESFATASSCIWPDPTGDIFDRTASVFLITDESCLAGRCMGTGPQLELVRIITPFGTSPQTGPRVLTYDITPYVPLLTGTRQLGVFVDTWDTNGWYVDVDFRLTENPLEASRRPPADGVLPLFFEYLVTSDSQPNVQAVSVTVPETAVRSKLRLFTTGHGAAGAGNCDEFCPKVNAIHIDGSPVWRDTVWRDDCSPIINPCSRWNACGWPSCTFDRSGWCPGFIACHDPDPCNQDIEASYWLRPGSTHDVLFQIEDITPGGASWIYSLALYWWED